MRESLLIAKLNAHRRSVDKLPEFDCHIILVCCSLPSAPIGAEGKKLHG